MDVRQASAQPKPEIRLSDYRPPAFRVEDIRLTFRLYEQFVEVLAISRIKRQDPDATALVLDGSAHFELLELKLDGQPLGPGAYVQGHEDLTIPNVGDAFELTVVTRLNPFENTRLEGLYFSGGNFCTQCEAEGFRHITYYVDRPDNLAKFYVRIEADKKSCPILLSNGNPAESGDLGDGRHYAEWDDPFPKPSYLFALVAGDLGLLSDSFTTRGGREVALNIYAARGDLDKCGHAMAALKRAMIWDEETFGLEYDLDVYNIVAVSDFNMGAMENKGLNVFNTKYVLASPETATDMDFDHVEGVIAHEYFHNWTGNRVTCRDWFQLSLKEGLTVFRDQEFSADMTSRAVKRLDDVRVLRTVQFPEDSGPLAHPVRPEKYIEINNFYTVTVYNKGAEVIRMMHRLIGAEAFRRGMDLYFSRHDGAAVTCEDFVRAMEDANGADLQQFRLWYSQAGTPKLAVGRKREGDSITVTVEQSCPPTPGQPTKRPFHMPFVIGWLDADGQEIFPELTRGEGAWSDDGCLLQIRKEHQEFSFTGVPDGAVLSLHRGFSCPVVVSSDHNEREQVFLSQHDTDPFARWEALQALVGTAIVQAAEDGGNDIPNLSGIVDAFGAVLADERSDPAFLAELLTLPGEIDLGQKMKLLEPGTLHVVREALLRKVAQAHGARMRDLYDRLAEEGYSGQADAKARRRLRNTLLAYLALLPGGESLVRGHFEAATNMTDRMAALTQVAHSDFSCRDDLLARYYSDWKDNALVIDKWFAVQALSKRPDTVALVRKLASHEAFTIANPNRLRSLVMTFASGNQVRFHDEDGAGYRFLADMIVKVDKLNPQTAARLVPALGRWKRLGGQRRKLMHEALLDLKSRPDLSDDVRELTEKSLI